MNKKCSICNNNFETSFRNHGVIYKNKKVYICKNCITKDKICEVCGKIFKVRITKYDTTRFCSSKCQRVVAISKMNTPEANKKSDDSNRKNGTGLYDAKIRKLGIAASVKTNRENKTGFFDPVIQRNGTIASHNPDADKKRIKSMRKNKVGFFDINFILKTHKTMKENKLGLYNPEIRKLASKRAIKTMKENKTGVFSIEHQIKASKAAIKVVKQNIKNFMSLNITSDLFVGDSLEEINHADYDSFKKYNKISGIWAIWGENSLKEKICLDVCQTSDIGNEMRLGMRKLVSQKVKKYNEFIKYKNIIFIIVKIDIKEIKERELIEAIYASKYNSLYWSPAPTQMTYIKNNINDIFDKLNTINTPNQKLEEI